MAIATGLNFGPKLVKLLGFEGRHVTKIVLTAEANELVHAEVTCEVELPHPSEWGSLALAVQEFVLVPKDELARLERMAKPLPEKP